MGLSHSPKIVNDGLVLCLDAANPRSYPGSGINFSDISGKNNNAILYNTPTFNTNRFGSLIFNGTNNYCQVDTRNTNLEFQPTEKFSVFVWAYNILSTTGPVISNMSASVGYSGWDLWIASGTQLAAHFISSWTTNAVKITLNVNSSDYTDKWVYIGYTYNGSSPTTSINSINSIEFYLNGILYTTGKEIFPSNEGDGFNGASEVITYDVNQRLRLSSRYSTQFSASNIAVAQVYNKQLSNSEINQNFNALRGRFQV